MSLSKMSRGDQRHKSNPHQGNDRVENFADEYVVEKILGKRFYHGRPQVLVKWVGLPDEDNSWEPMENVANAMRLLCDFEAERYRLKESALATLKKDLPLSPSTSAVSLVDQSPKRTSKPEMKSKGKQDSTLSTVGDEESKKKFQGKWKGSRPPATPKQSNNSTPKASKELPSCSHSGNVSKATFNEKRLETPKTGKTPSAAGLQRHFRVLNLSESSDEETEAATSLDYQRTSSPKLSLPKPRCPLAFPEDAPQMAQPIAPTVPQQKEAEDLENATEDSVSDSSSSDSSLASSCNSTCSSGSSSSRSRSCSSSSTLSEGPPPAPEKASLDSIRKEARKWDAEKRVAKFNDLNPKSVSPNIVTSDTTQAVPKKIRRQSLQEYQPPVEDPIDSELQRSKPAAEQLGPPRTIIEATRKARKIWKVSGAAQETLYKQGVEHASRRPAGACSISACQVGH
ncbi:chromo domain-containing protein cec-1 isoform X2 [Drosophila biarmipes]|uniref:chromo domain-containing protein cec-1 isoform X2 n=1 Tax=Drosophila biarmipes TaxID=125945 RepID=UPI001CDA5806|nr:chromo domain-containing protein cec-1 isoform X2 [Drosophila biarmipes]